MGQDTRYRPLPDQAYDPRVTDLDDPLNVPAATGPQALLSIDPATGNAMTTKGGWFNRNVTQTIPVQLTAGVSLRCLVNNPKRTGCIIQNEDAAATLNYSWGNDIGLFGKSIAPGGADLYDFTTPSDALYLFCATANIRVLVMEISRAG
jgi:hypothetical protein